jgi:hypothetical protein
MIMAKAMKRAANRVATKPESTSRDLGTMAGKIWDPRTSMRRCLRKSWPISTTTGEKP